MSGAHAHSPDHHEGADHGHGLAANNSLRFNNGGVLGVANAFTNLIKGVTYDAAKETFGGAHNAHGADHHGAHGADHGAHGHAANNSDHHAPDAAHGGHGAVDAHGHPIAAAAAAAAGHAAGHGHDHGHDDHDADLSDKLIHYLAHAGHYNSTLPLLAKGLSFVKEKLFPTIHEIPTEDQAIGNQILHKLKKDKKAAKKGVEAIDHHAFEGFFKALDTANLKRTFKMFVDKDRFKKALKSESGREEIKKEVANLFDLSGTVDRKEVEDVYKHFEKLLHIHAHRHHGDIDVGTDHAKDPRITKQYVELIKVIFQANELLDQAALDKIYGTEEKEDDFEMNYDKIGDTILKVNSKSLKPFLNRIQKDGIDDMEVKVGDLLDPANVAAELTHNPDDLREEIQNLFNVKGTVNKQKLAERKAQIEKRLKMGEAVDPYTATRDAIVALLETAFNNLDEATLKKLYPEAAQEGSGFEWTEEKYKNFSSTVFVSINTKNRANALKKFDPDTLEASFSGLLPSLKVGSLNTEPGRKKLVDLVVALTGVTEPFDAAEITDRVTAILKRLGDGTLEAAKFAEVKAVLDKVAPLFTPDVIKKLFEASEWTGADNFINHFIDLEDEADVQKQVRGYQSATVQGEYVYLFDANELDRVIKDGTEEERDEAKKQIRAFAKQQIGNVTVERRKTILKAYRDQLARVTGLSTTTGYKNLEADLTTVESNLTGARLGALFTHKKPQAKETINHAQLGQTIMGLDEDKKRETFSRSVDIAQVNDLYESLGTEAALKSELDKDPLAVRSKFYNLFAFESGPLSETRLSKRAAELYQRLGVTTPNALGSPAQKVAAVIQDASKSFAAVKAETVLKDLDDRTWDIGYHHFAAYVVGSVRTKADVGSFLRAYNDRALRAEFPSLYPASKIPNMMKKGADREQVKTELVNLLALRGRIDIESLRGQVDAIDKQLESGSSEATKHAQLIATLNEAVGAAEPYMTELFDSRESVVNVSDWGRSFDGLNEEDEVVAFLRGYAKASRQFDAMFKELMDASLFDKAASNDRSRELLVRKIQILIGLDATAISIELTDVNSALDEQAAKLGAEASLPDNNTKAQHKKILENLIKIKATLAADKRLEKLMKGSDLQPEYEKLGSQIKTLDDAKLVAMIEKFNSGLFTDKILHLRGLDQDAGTDVLNFKMLAARVNTIKNLLGIPDSEELDPAQIPFLAQLMKAKLAGLTSYFARTPVGAANLRLLLDLFELIAKPKNVDWMRQTMGMESLNQHMTTILQKRFTPKDGVKWKDIQRTLSPKVLTTLALIESQGGEVKFLFVDDKGDYIFGDGGFRTAPQTRNKKFKEAMDQCHQMGADMMTTGEYAKLLENSNYTIANESLWLRYDTQAAIGSWGVNNMPGSPKDGQKNMRVKGATDPDYQDPNVGFRRVVRVASL